MRKITIATFFSVFFIIAAYANISTVGPGITISGAVDNQTPFQLSDHPWPEKVAFNSYQDVFGYFDDKGIFVIEAIEGTVSQLFVSYSENDNFSDEQQCEFNVSVNKNGVATVSVQNLPDSFILCTLSGTPLNNFTLHLQWNEAKYKQLTQNKR